MGTSHQAEFNGPIPRKLWRNRMMQETDEEEKDGWSDGWKD